MSLLRSLAQSAADAWKRIRAWRRIRFTRAGLLFTLGALGVGFAAINTGNNLLYLLLGAMLGAMAVSGWLSEQTLRGLAITRSAPTGIPVEQDVRIRYRVTNRKGRLASFAVELQEPGLPGPAFIPRVRPGERAEGQATERFLISETEEERVPTQLFNGYAQWVEDLYPDAPREPTGPIIR